MLAVVVILIVAVNAYRIEDRLKSDLRALAQDVDCLLYTSPSPRDATLSRMPSSA